MPPHPPPRRVVSALEEEVPFEGQDTADEQLESAIHGLVEPTPEIIQALQECQGKWGGIRLNMGSMRIAFLPFEVKTLVDLKILNLRNNRLTMFPAELCAALNDLEELNLGQNLLTYLPENLSALSNLRKLILQDNRINILPMGIFGLPVLQELRLDNNLLTDELPGQIADLSVLNTLTLSNNHLRKLPTRMDELKFLTRVDLTNNPIEVCPPSITLLHQKNELLMFKSKRKGLIKRCMILKATNASQLELVLQEELKE